MIVTVKLFGTLSAGVTGYDHAQGLEVPLSEGASIGDLLIELGIEASKHPVVAVEGRIRKEDHRISDGNQIHIFQPVHGG
jgi:sulfur carrier protein ThiS